MRTLLVDDNPEFLRAAERMIMATPGLELIGCAGSGEEALEQVRARKPELVLMDWSLPDLNGLETTRRIKALLNPPRVILLGLQDYPEYRLAAREAGAEGFISKAEFADKISSFIDYLTAQDGFKEPSGTADRDPEVQRTPEPLNKLGKSLQALEAPYLHLQHLLEGRGKEMPSGQRDQALSRACRDLGKALRGMQEEFLEIQRTPGQEFLGPFTEAAEYYLLFEVNRELFGLPAKQVLSVEKPVPLIRLPREYYPLVGLADRDHRRIPIIDLRLWGGVGTAPPGEAGRLILVETRVAIAGLLVDSVRELTTSAAATGYPLPSNPEVGRKPYRDRLIQVKDRFIFVWDVDKIVDRLNLTEK
jgi:DNA-binding NarL/FixJ family response regulator/chemotaxis signal transduction protein